MRSVVGAVLVGGSLAATLAGATAHAAAPAPVRLEFRAPASCPDESVFFGQMQARTTLVRRAAPNEAALTFVVEIAAEANRFVGRLVLNENARASRPRQVSSKDCADVVSALALIASLTVDPNADAAAIPVRPASPPTPPSSPTDPPGPPPTTTAPVEPPAPPPTDSASAREATTSAAPERGVSADRVARTETARSDAARAWLIGLAFDVLAAGTGAAAPRFGALAGVRWDSGPSLDVTISGAASHDDVSEGQARLLWITGAVVGCPVRLRLAAPLALAPCADVEAGAIRVTGGSVPNPTTQLRPWLAAGGVARLELALLDRVLMLAQAGLAAPLVRDTFYFLPATNAYQPPAGVGWAGIGTGVRFR